MISLFATVSDSGVSSEKIRLAAGHALKKLGYRKADLSVHVVGEARMRHLNTTYRGISRPTDVLSFAAGEGMGGAFPASAELGDIFLCPPYIRRQAKRFSVPYAEEFLRMLIHGILHIVGHDHAKEASAKTMFRIQERLLHEIL